MLGDIIVSQLRQKDKRHIIPFFSKQFDYFFYNIYSMKLQSLTLKCIYFLIDQKNSIICKILYRFMKKN